jgi:hypothetical protein
MAATPTMRRILNISTVGAISLAIAGLLVSGLYKIRIEAERARCRNNLAQVGGALQSYHVLNNSFPCGTMPNDQLAPEDRLSWIAAIGSYAAGRSPMPRLDKTKAWSDAENHSIVVESFPWLLCPANQNTAETGMPGLTHYVGIAGIGQKAATLPVGSPHIGVFGYNRSTSRDDIKAALNATMMVVETGSDNGPWAAGGRATVRGLDPSRLPYLGRSGQFSAMHSTTNSLFADGSVRSLASSMDPRVFEAMATIVHGEDVPQTVDE